MGGGGISRSIGSVDSWAGDRWRIIPVSLAVRPAARVELHHSIWAIMGQEPLQGRQGFCPRLPQLYAYSFSWNASSGVWTKTAATGRCHLLHSGTSISQSVACSWRTPPCLLRYGSSERLLLIRMSRRTGIRFVVCGMPIVEGYPLPVPKLFTDPIVVQILRSLAARCSGARVTRSSQYSFYLTKVRSET